MVATHGECSAFADDSDLQLTIPQVPQHIRRRRTALRCSVPMEEDRFALHHEHFSAVLQRCLPVSRSRNLRFFFGDLHFHSQRRFCLR
jgi:hypothetical protein